MTKILTVNRGFKSVFPLFQSSQSVLSSSLSHIPHAYRTCLTPHTSHISHMPTAHHFCLICGANFFMTLLLLLVITGRTGEHVWCVFVDSLTRIQSTSRLRTAEQRRITRWFAVPSRRDGDRNRNQTARRSKITRYPKVTPRVVEEVS